MPGTNREADTEAPGSEPGPDSGRAGATPPLGPGPAKGEAEENRRPGVVLLVYSWDMVLAIFAVFGALAAFGGRLVVGDQSFDVPVPMQILSALSAAAYAAALIIIATLLTRRLRWVRQAQVVVLATAIALILVSVATARVIGGGRTDYSVLLGNLLFALIDAVAILVMTGRGIGEWYAGVAPVPSYVQGTIAFWASSGAALIVFQAFR